MYEVWKYSRKVQLPEIVHEKSKCGYSPLLQNKTVKL